VKTSKWEKVVETETLYSLTNLTGWELSRILQGLSHMAKGVQTYEVLAMMKEIEELLDE